MRKTLFIIGMLCCALLAQAQDPQFSQYNASPTTLNPALTGFFTGDYRIVTNFRSQWGSFVEPYRTMAVSAEVSLFKGKMQNDHFGIGISFLNDKSGTIEFSTNQIALSAAYKKNFGNSVKHGVALGFQGAFLQQRINANKLIFDNQYNGVEVDPGRSSGETIATNGKGGIDMAVGGLYQVIPNRYYNFYVGAAYFHLIQPNLSFLDNPGDFTIKPKYVVHAGAKLDFTKTINLLPSVAYFRQASSQQINIGTYLQLVLEDELDYETSFSLGTWVRITDPLPDAIIFGARIDYMNFVFGFSYDMNISPLKTASESRGAYELSLIYTGKLVTRGQRNLMIPCPQL